MKYMLFLIEYKRVFEKNLAGGLYVISLVIARFKKVNTILSLESWKLQQIEKRLNGGGAF